MNSSNYYFYRVGTFRGYRVGETCQILKCSYYSFVKSVIHWQDGLSCSQPSIEDLSTEDLPTNHISISSYRANGFDHPYNTPMQAKHCIATSYYMTT